MRRTGPEGGACVRYPAEELLGLLALESHRQRCLVVGEDLGEDQVPHWRRKLGAPLQALARHTGLQAVVQALAARSWRAG